MWNKSKIISNLTIIFFLFSPLSLFATSSTDIKLPTVNALQGVTQPRLTGQNANYFENVLLADSSKQCQTNETDNYCWLRYMINTAGDTVVTNKIECPSGYLAVDAFSDQVQDAAGNKYRYYRASTYLKVTQTQFTLLSSSYHYTCGVSASGVQDSGQTFDKPGSSKVLSDGYLGSLSSCITNTVDNRGDCNTDTTEYAYYISGSHKYDRDHLDNCKIAKWCGYRTRYDYTYTWTQCTRPAGFYPSFSAADAFVVQEPPTDNQFSPTTVICGKSDVKWQK